jgi:inner membrane protein
VDPITHTLAGASMARAGLHRVSPLATATLILGANAPDIDIFASVAGSYASLALRRGWTHGPVAMVVLPFVVAGLVMGWDRWIRRRRHPTAPPVRWADILLLALLGVASHVPLDWLNTYGVRLLMPFSGRWFYGDAVFIVDPWLWLILGGGLAVAGGRSRRGTIAWGALGILLSLPLLLAPQVPDPARGVWLVGMTVVVLLRMRVGVPPLVPRGNSAADRPALLSSVLALVYIVVLVGASAVGERMGREVARSGGTPEIREVLYSPRPANPFAAGLVVVTGEDYRHGSFRWFPGPGEPRVRLEDRAVPRGDWSDPAVARALEHPDVRHYLVWSRFPFVQVEPVEEGTAVTVGDARYPAGTAAGGLEGVRIVVPPLPF